MGNKIRVTILDDHQSIIDGYLYRLQGNPKIEVAATLTFGENLERSLKEQPADVLLLDINVPTSPQNSNPYPILNMVPKLLQRYPDMNILVISMFAERGLIRAVMETGVSGYILKDDPSTLKDLGSVITSVANGGIHFSQKAHKLLLERQKDVSLSPRQLEVLSMCIAYPDSSTSDLADRLAITNSTVRNLLSNAYLKLDVHNRSAAIAKARDLGLITPYTQPPISVD